MVCRQLDWHGYLLLVAALLLLPFPWLIAVFLAGTVHELGHYLALRGCGVRVFGIRIGIFGAKMNVGQMERWQELVCALAGPLAGFLMVLFSRWLPRTAVCAVIHSAYNLLPVYPLDGGRALRSVCASEKVCHCIEFTCLGLIAIAGLYGSFALSLGLLPMGASILTIHRALAGKGLAKPGLFRYNRERIYE